MTIEELKARLVELNETGKAIRAKADAEKRDLSGDEQTELDSVMNEFDGIEVDIARRDRLANQENRLSASAGRVVPAQRLAGQDVENVAVQRTGLQNTVLPTAQERGRWGFRNFGEFCAQVRNGTINPGAMDQRLITNALTTYGSEGVSADGGFAVPPEWRATIMALVDAEDSLLSKTDMQTVSGNTITFPIDETSAWQATGGIQTYWDGEAATMTQSKPQLKDLTVKLHRLTALVPVTDELLEDAPAMGGYVTRKAGEKIAFKLNDAIINGTGAGMPLGLMNAPCLVSVAKVASQVAATIHADNIVAMIARMPAKMYSRSVWLVNQDCIPQIMKLGFTVGNAAGTVAGGTGGLWLPPSGLQGANVYGNILGRPVIVTEACQTLGTKGDIVLFDPTMYLSVMKSSGIKSDVSIHLYFDQNVTAFRFVLRMNGQCWLSAPIGRKNGSNTLSCAVTLDTRS